MESLVEISNQIMQLGSLYYVHFEQDDLREMVEELYSIYRFAPLSDLVKCELKVETIPREEEQVRLVENYYKGVNNHE